MTQGRPKLPQGLKVKDYQIIDFIGAGGYGDIYTVQNIKDNKLYAMKIEYFDAEKQGLDDEVHFMKKIQGTPLLPILYINGTQDNFRYLIMELLGPSISAMRRSLPNHCYNNFSVNALAFHMLECIEELHRHGITHRDIKPGNFLLRPDRMHPICLIDFGLSKSYISPITSQHIPYSNKAGFTGTCRYASVNAHDSIELSRRDDLYSWFYSVIELAEGRVPWPGSKNREATVTLKKTMTIQELCQSLSPQFMEIYRSIRSLSFPQQPNYDRIKSLICEAIIEIPKPHLYDWESKEYIKNNDEKKISFSMKMDGDCSDNDIPFEGEKVPEVTTGCANCEVI